MRMFLLATALLLAPLTAFADDVGMGMTTPAAEAEARKALAEHGAGKQVNSEDLLRKLAQLRKETSAN